MSTRKQAPAACAASTDAPGRQLQSRSRLAGRGHLRRSAGALPNPSGIRLLGLRCAHDPGGPPTSHRFPTAVRTHECRKQTRACQRSKSVNLLLLCVFGSGTAVQVLHIIMHERLLAQSLFLPSVRPSFRPSVLPSFRPSVLPSFRPSVLPSFLPSFRPSVRPSFRPSFLPSFLPSVLPSFLSHQEPEPEPNKRPPPP